MLDIGLHLRLPMPFGDGALRTTEAALELLRDRCHQGPYASADLARYLGRPGQALADKVGERVWLAGRSSFPGDRRAFHRQALELGALGLDQLTAALQNDRPPPPSASAAVSSGSLLHGVTASELGASGAAP